MAKLTALKSKAVLRRNPQKRFLKRALRGEGAAEAIGPITPGCEIFGFTKGQFSCIDVLLHCLKHTGPADVFIATWSAAAGDIAAAHEFLKDGRIRNIRFLVDYSFQSRKPEFCDEIMELFGADAIRVTVTHAKYMLVRNAGWNLVIRTSMNLNYNPRYENFEISDDLAFADFQQSIVEEIWENRDAADSFGVRPQDHKNTFNKDFQVNPFEGLASLKDLV